MIAGPIDGSTRQGMFASPSTARIVVSRAGFVAICLGVALVALAAAQGTREDFDRAERLEAETRNRVTRQFVRPHWLPDQPRFWYRVQTGTDTFAFVLVDCELGQRREAFDHQRLAMALGQATSTTVDPQRLPFRDIRFSAERDQLLFTVDGQSWQCRLDDYQLTRAESTELAGETSVDRLERPRRSRDQGGDTSVRFINRRDQSVRLFWIDRSGQRVAYGEIAAGESREQHTYAGHVWLVTDAEDTTLEVFRATEEPGDALIGDERLPVEDSGEGSERAGRRGGRGTSPDGLWEASIQDHNVWLQETVAGESCQLTRNGSEDDPYLERYYWSPDSTHLLVIQEQHVESRTIPLVESTPEDQLQPKLHELSYAKPGDPLPRSRPRLFDIATRSQVEIAEDLFNNPWDLTGFRWEADSSRFTFVYNERGHQALRIIAVDARSGSAAALIDERSDTFVDYAHKQFSYFREAAPEVIWMSERDGWNHLYRFDSVTGKLINQITSGNWVVRSVDRVDDQAGQIWFYAGGINPAQDPYYLHFCRVNVDGTELVDLTPENGTHSVEFSSDRRYLIDRFSRVDLPPVTQLRDANNGRLICQLEQADASKLLTTGWRPPEPFVASGRDGVTPIFGIVHLPRNHDPQKKYPVIESIYAGPQGSFVPKTFAAYHRQQALAELGFIVVQIDGMGTSHRSKAFHNVCWKNLGDAGFPDRILWLQAAAHKWPSMDLSRVGIYGGSAGGQSALRALLAHPEHYHVAVADCGCHDNRVDKMWWNELWMGWPIGDHYHEQSNVTQAGKLQGKLLLTVAEMDRNVDPASTLQVVKALIAADKDFELIVFPGAGHGIGESRYGRRRRADFFVRHLLGGAG
jgi:dipeptidyl aminopeptidase/acylaminoacyl peptidase